MRDATDLAADEINAAGVLGGSLELLHRDSRTNAAAAVDAATELVFVEGVPVIIGAAASGVSLPVAGVTVPNEVVQISPSSTSPVFSTFEPEEPGWFWRTVFSDALQGKVAGRYAFNDKGWRNVAILARADTYGSGLAQTFQDTFEGLGGTITARVDYDVTATVFNTELTTIFASNPEAVWWVAFPFEGELIMQQWWANPAWRGPSWLWSEGTRAQTFVDDLISQGIGVEGMEGTAPIGNGPNFETFRTAYLAKYGKEPNIFAANTYDALYLAALGAVAREAVDSLSIRDSLIAVSNPPGTVVGPGPGEFARAVGILEAGGNIDYEGASGRVNFDLVGDVGKDYEIWSISPAGQIQQIVAFPEDAVWPATPGTTAPTASFTVTPSFGGVTTPFTVDASASSDAEDAVTALEVQWDWENDGIWDTIWTGEKTAEHQYTSPSTYAIRLRVRDTGTLMDSTTRQVEVASPPSIGPWLDRIIWSEQADRSLALDQIIAGSDDAALFGMAVRADKERALASDQIHRSSTFGLIDNFLMNPSRQDPTNPQFSENPFAIDEVRAAMQLLIDRELIARDIWGGFALARGGVSFHPLSPDYRRSFPDFLPLEEQWSFDSQAGKDMMFAALQNAGWSIGGDNLWHDSQGNLVTIRGLIRIEDERLQMGAYYADLLRALNFNVEENRGTFSSVGLIVYAQQADQNLWNFYTAAWSFTAIDTWDDEIGPWFWGCGGGFEPYCLQRPDADPANQYLHVVNQELADIGDQLRLGSYNTLAERQTLIARGAELLMQAPIRVFIDGRESLNVFNNRFQNGVFDLFGGPTNPWFLKSATVPPEPAGAPFEGERVARVLNQNMFVDGWNPWQTSQWLDDEVQRRAMTDFGMWRHPHTGTWIDIRNKATVVTAGPGGTLPVADTAVVFNTATNTWDTVPATEVATSKVTLGMVFGNWHTGQPITMDDVMYAYSNGWRRVEGDISGVLPNTASASEVLFYQDQVVGLHVTSATTLDVYLNFWHVDSQEIAGVASFFPSYSWEVGELAVQTLLDGETAINEQDAQALGIPWLDLTKGASLAFLAADLQSLKAANHIPPGMDIFITPAEATAHWAALDAFATAKGHYWPSNGPFILEDVDLVNRQTIMVANRDYPWAADFWDELATLPALREPQNFQTLPDNGQVGLTWLPPTSDGVSPITRYHLYRGTVSGSLTFLVEVSNVLSYTDTTVTNGVTYYYQVSAVNAVGEGPRSDEAPATPTDTTDTTNPTLSITSPANGAILDSTSAVVSGTASDDVGVAKVELSTDGTTWVLATGTTSWSGTMTLVEGPNTIFARATDTAGNTATVSIEVTVGTFVLSVVDPVGDHTGTIDVVRMVMTLTVSRAITKSF